jgi:hypothetical protein
MAVRCVVVGHMVRNSTLDAGPVGVSGIRLVYDPNSALALAATSIGASRTVLLRPSLPTSDSEEPSGFWVPGLVSGWARHRHPGLSGHGHEYSGIRRPLHPAGLRYSPRIALRFLRRPHPTQRMPRAGAPVRVWRCGRRAAFSCVTVFLTGLSNDGRRSRPATCLNGSFAATRPRQPETSPRNQPQKPAPEKHAPETMPL